MKVRIDFVTNSSSTSYLVIKIILDEIEISDSLRTKIEKVLDDEDVDYIIQLKGQSVDNWSGEVKHEWDLKLDEE